MLTPLKPMLLQMHKDAFNDENYIFEPKWDGWRILLYKHGNQVHAFTRHGNCVTAQFPELEQVADNIRTPNAILDCEGICFRDGRSVFDDFSYRGRLRNAVKIRSAVRIHPATFVVFDVLETSKNHMQEPLMDRKSRLEELVNPSPGIIPTIFVEGAGVQLKKFTEERRWEGCVAKRANSTYRPNTRSPDWLKIKNWKTIDAVILGYRREPQFGLVIGLHFPTVRNQPVAVVEYGMKPEERAGFLQVVRQIHTKMDRGTQWIEPVICCEVQYLERTEKRHLRTVVFKKFKPKQNPEDCIWVS